MRPWLAPRLAFSTAILSALGMTAVDGLRAGEPAPRSVTAVTHGADLQGAAPFSAPRSFYFSRAAYSGRGRFGFGRSWRTDYPKADQQFLTVLRRLTILDASEREHPVRLDDPELRRFPFLYAVEVGNMDLTEGEVRGLRDYLLAGGFLVVDDFWGTAEWHRFESQMRRVFPERRIVDLPLSHPVFHAYYRIEELIQVPNVSQGVRGGPTHERDGYLPACRGILDDDGRLMVVINWNTDLGDAWEWAEQERYPLRFSTFAYQMGVNFIVYAMSH